MRRRPNGLFQRLLEAGSRTTYHGKIRTRGGKRKATVRFGKQSVYKGVRIIPVGNGEFETSLDSSRFESKRDARRFVDAWKKQGNPAIPYPVLRQTGERDRLEKVGGGIGPGFNVYQVPVSKLKSVEDIRGMKDKLGDVERYRDLLLSGSEPPALFGHFHKRSGQVTVTSGSRRLMAAKQAGVSTLPVAIPNPKGKKGDFSRCVKAVSQRKGAKDPNAICAASERKRGLINPPLDSEERKRIRAEVRKQDAARKRLRKKQDRLISMAETRGYPDHFQISPDYAGSPTVGQLRGYVFPEWENSIDSAIKRMARERGRRNPAGAAQAVSEEFHGRPVREMVPVQQKRHYHKYLAELGELRKLVVESRDGKHRVTLSGFKHAMLCTNEDKNQLFIVGGDQSVHLKDFGIKDPHETETLGEVPNIEYFTDKEHLGDEGGTAVYVHKFRSTNDNGKHKSVRMARNPDLIYYLRDEHLEFSGGSYFIRAEGIDL